MRVTMLSKAMVVGAYQRKLEELARLPGVELTVIVPPGWRDSRGETPLERAYTAGYELVVTPIALNGHFHSHFYPRLGRELSRARPDLIHVDEEPYNLAAWQAIRWAVQRHTPAIFFTWQNLNRRYPPPFDWIERFNYRHAARAIAGNREAAEVLRAKGFARPIAMIPQFGVDPDLFTQAGVVPLATWSQPAPLTVGFAGGLVPDKGVDVLLRAVAACRFRAAGPAHTGAPACRVLIAGSGSQRPALEALATDLGLGDAARFLGRVESRVMPRFYASIDVLVLPSRTLLNWKEQFGRVLVEAMACGVPVIGSDSGEIPHVIGPAGWIFPEDDAAALAAMLQRLAGDRALRAELGRRGRERAQKNYTQERIAQATFEVYRQTLEA